MKGNSPTAYAPDPKNRRDFRLRRQESNQIRRQVRASAADDFVVSVPPVNGDEERFEQIGFPGFASFTKALKHDANGLVKPESFNSLLQAIDEGTQETFNKVQLGGCNRLLAN
ncbi:MAG: phosphatidic acid phosphatase, partial [Leptolyngbya sp. SIO3F4]|nr:phosphatidic acid phosphatase [Leptolyngbya sp. SIO3F4]